METLVEQVRSDLIEFREHTEQERRKFQATTDRCFTRLDKMNTTVAQVEQPKVPTGANELTVDVPQFNVHCCLDWKPWRRLSSNTAGRH